MKSLKDLKAELLANPAVRQARVMAEIATSCLLSASSLRLRNASVSLGLSVSSPCDVDMKTHLLALGRLFANTCFWLRWLCGRHVSK